MQPFKGNLCPVGSGGTEEIAGASLVTLNRYPPRATLQAALLQTSQLPLPSAGKIVTHRVPRRWVGPAAEEPAR